MKKVIAVAGLLMLVGCTTEKIVVERVPDTTIAVETTIPAPEAGVDTYMDNIVAMYPEAVNQFGRNWLIEYGQTTCDAIDDGMTLQDLLEMTMRNGVDAEMIGFLTGEAIRNFCPENQWFIDAALGA